MQTALKVALVESLQKEHRTITLADDQAFVIVCECLPKFISKDIQVLPVSGGGGGAREQKPRNDTRFDLAQIDLDGLMSRVSVEVINVVRDSNNYHRMYVNCKVGVHQKVGFDTWKGAYESFVRKALLRTWGTVILRTENGKTFLNFRKAKNEAARTVLHFAIK